eukprot:SAG22_NODE_2550_length_2454_cov_2.338004_3_plen_554_part_01
MGDALPHGCRLYIAMHENWDPRTYEQSMDVLDLPLVTTYIGDNTARLREYLVAASASFNAVLFYHWTPSMLLANGGFTELSLSTDPAFCEHEWGAQMCRRTTGDTILTLTSASLKFRLPDAWSLLQSFNVDDTDIAALLRKHPNNPASSLANVRDAACEWLTESEAKWRPWVETALEQADIKMNVTIGLLFPSIIFGEQREQLQLRAAQLAIAHVNADDSVLSDIRLVVHTEDLSMIRILNGNPATTTEQKIAEAQSISLGLASSNPVAAVGAGWSSDVVSVAPNLHVPLLSPSATNAKLSNSTNYPLFGRLCLSDSRQAQALADVVRFFGWTRVGMVHCDDMYCRGLADGTRGELASLGIEVGWIHEVDRQMLPGDVVASTAHIEDKVNDCTGVRPDETAVIILITHEAELLLGGVAEAGLDVTWLGTESIGSTAPGSNTMSSDILAVRASGVDNEHDKYQALVAALPEAGTDLFSILSYDAVYTLAYAMDAVRADGGNVYNATSVMAAVSTVAFDGASGDVRFDAQHDRVGNFDIVEFTAGQIESVGGWDGN